MTTITEATVVRTRIYRGIEIQFWQSGVRWFASSSGQNCNDDGYSTLTQALEQAEKFIGCLDGSF
jgi:hypothetical protein